MSGRRGSLPTRERELKLGEEEGELGGLGSLPTRERELKLRHNPSDTGSSCRSLHGSVN